MKTGCVIQQVASATLNCICSWSAGRSQARRQPARSRVRTLDGVITADANPTTGAMLVRFDPARTDVPAIVAAIDPPVRPRRPFREVGHLRLVVG